MKMNLKDFQKCNHQTSRISHDILQQQQQGDHDILILFQTYILLLNMLLEIPNYSLRELSLLVFRTPNFTEEIHQENAEAEAMINQRMDGSEPSRADGHEGYDTSYEHARGADRSAIRRTARGSRLHMLPYEEDSLLSFWLLEVPLRTMEADPQVLLEHRGGA